MSRSTLLSLPVFSSVVMASVAMLRFESVMRFSRSRLQAVTADGCFIATWWMHAGQRLVLTFEFYIIDSMVSWIEPHQLCVCVCVCVLVRVRVCACVCHLVEGPDSSVSQGCFG